MTDNEYEELKVFFATYVDVCVSQDRKSSDPKHQPFFFLGELERSSMAKAKSGLRMAVNDIVELSSSWAPEQVSEVDRQFLERGVLSLSEVRKKYSKRYIQILNRGIRSLEDYYLIKGVVDGVRDNLSAEEEGVLVTMLTNFEQNLIDGAEK